MTVYISLNNPIHNNKRKGRYARLIVLYLAKPIIPPIAIEKLSISDKVGFINQKYHSYEFKSDVGGQLSGHRVPVSMIFELSVFGNIISSSLSFTPTITA